MRIIGGLARGIQLKSPHGGLGIKPTMDRVREAIFGSQEPFAGKTVVDLFACSGAMGLEACSRGAARVAWFEYKKSLCTIIRENIERVEHCLGENMPEHKLYHADVLAAPRLLSAWQPDLILADPPYNPTDDQKGSYHLLNDAAFAAWARSALVIMEQSRHNPLHADCLKLWQVERTKTYGDQLVYFLRSRTEA